jgi:TfoX N-terminal domain
MVFDEDFAFRIRAALGDVRGVTEIRMFGGLCFAGHGNMAVGVTGDDLVVRLAPDEGEAALAQPAVRPMDFTGRPMKGFVYVGPEALKTERMLTAWASRGADLRSDLAALGPAALRELQDVLTWSEPFEGRRCRAHSGSGHPLELLAQLIAIADTDRIARLRLLRGHSATSDDIPNCSLAGRCSLSWRGPIPEGPTLATCH